jgi:hypothetical protein
MVVTAVQSTTLSSTVYDASRQLLWLEFQSGAVYGYFGVPPQVHQDLISAPSKGKYFNRSIRGRFAYRKEPDSGRSRKANPPSHRPERLIESAGSD